MKEVNFDAIYEHTSTKYGDYTGVIQVDMNESVLAVRELCKNHNIDLGDKFVIGIGFDYDNSMGSVTIYTINSEIYGTTYNSVRDKIAEIGLTVQKKLVWMSIIELMKYIKRMAFLVTSDLLANVESFKIESKERFDL